MNLLIDNRTDEPLTAELEDAIRRAAAEALRYEEFDEDCEISVSIVDNEEIREINRQFRSIDRATDVLSFPMLTKKQRSTRMTKSFWGILLFLWSVRRSRRRNTDIL